MPRLMLRAMSGSVALGQPGSGLTSVVSAVTEGLGDTQGQVSLLSPCWCLSVMLQPEPHRPEWPMLLSSAMVVSRPELYFYVLSCLSYFIDLYISVFFELFNHGHNHSFEFFVWRFFHVNLIRDHYYGFKLFWRYVILILHVVLFLCYDLYIWS